MASVDRGKPRQRLAALLVVVSALLGGSAFCGCPTAQAAELDLILRGGLICDGSGAEPYRGDVAIDGDRIVAIGDLGGKTGKSELQLQGLAVAPGFINVLSWATESLLADPKSQSDIRQGVTLEVFGEGWSMGPWSERMKQDIRDTQGDIKFAVEWTTLAEYLEHLVARGVAPNLASFVGATTVRIHVLGYEDRAPQPQELDQMRALVRQAMEEGALGVGSSLIYAPAFYAKTPELVELCKVAAEYDGVYISHLRSEGNRFLEAVDELIEISRQAKIPAEIYHLKAAGEENWPKFAQAIAKIEAARAEGLKITADMYTYTAGATGLNAAMPPWVQEGGLRQWIERLQDPATRIRVIREMRTPSDDWENLLLAAGSPEKVLLTGFKTPALKKYTGKSLAAVAAERGTSPEETAIDLVVQDQSRIDTVYFLMSEENVQRGVALPWVSFGSDAGSLAPEGVFLKSSTHPRAYGNFARVFAKYVRADRLMSLGEAVRKMTSLPAENFHLAQRGRLQPGYFADVVVFDPATIQDHATYENPQQYATGVRHVWVNGKQVLRDGEHTGALPGRVVKGAGSQRAK